jgi:predicted XRE-type DNA-binding protein
VFYDIADTPEEAANLTARSLLMIAIEQRIKEKGWTQARAAEILHVNQPRVSDLMNGKLSKFSLDALVNMLPAVGLIFDVRPIDTPRRVVRAKSPERGSRTRKTTQNVAAAATRSAPKVAASTKRGPRA